MELLPDEGPIMVAADAGSSGAGMDCGAVVTVLVRAWTADVDGRPLDAKLPAAWSGHVRGCSACAEMFHDLGELAGFGASEHQVGPLTPGHRDTDGCRAMLRALRPWAERKLAKSDGKQFEPELVNHLCGCYGCRQLIQIFGGEIGLSFG